MRSHKLGELVTFHYGKSLPKSKRVDGQFPVMSSAGVTGFHNDFLVKGPGLIVGRKGSIGTVYYEERDFFPIDTCFYLTVNDPSVLDLRYLYYLLSLSNLKDLNSDAAVPGLNRDIAYLQTIQIPDKNAQLSCVSLLDKYDYLITNNNRRIAILVEMAQSLYREWFVNFRYPGHENQTLIDSALGPIPEGWEVKTLRGVLELAYGKALKKADRKGGPVSVYGSGGNVGSHEVSITQGPCIIVGRKGNVGKVFWVDSDCWPIDTVFYVKSPLSKYFLYQNLRLQKFYNSDAAVPGLNRDSAYSNNILVPPDGLLDNFDECAKSLFDMRYRLERSNNLLKMQRDLLLPKLISGQIELKD
ncbi:hypothetical protein GCM10011369_18910 [Neiella marina]|uniref:Type I restriction modification DNA specificity domain-containing protein n=1 Tax=Neiella marina TaxID=508461 RepID=A0A8J2XP51_9GAMM|nr:restriction endonuclease subunit S [Neiella marina]GGA77266.1 hypothetical protein GCM10011369_18910 [Neiella marina]